MKQTEESFLKSPIGKIIKMISLHYSLGDTTQQEIKDITSMKEIAGW